MLLKIKKKIHTSLTPLKGELNPICHLQTLLGDIIRNVHCKESYL